MKAGQRKGYTILSTNKMKKMRVKTCREIGKTGIQHLLDPTPPSDKSNI